MMWVNYPNMPTGACADMALYKRLVEFGRNTAYSFAMTIHTALF